MKFCAVGDLSESKCWRSQRNLVLCVTCRKVSIGGVNEICGLRMTCRRVSIDGVHKISENV